jgi:hypothetical protein
MLIVRTRYLGECIVAPPDRTSTLLALPLFALLTYVAAMIPFAVFLAQGWDAAAILEPVAIVLPFNILVRRSFP